MQDEGAIKTPGRLPKALILAPTRELARQITDEIIKIAKELTCLSIYGGTAYDAQIDALRRGVDVVIGTTGRMKVRACRFGMCVVSYDV